MSIASEFADLPPGIIHILRVLIDRESYPPGHAQWVEDGVREILKKWDSAEDLAQLKLDLGLVSKKRRRKEITMRRETTIAAAIVDAALTGSIKPTMAAGDTLQADQREVQRAWKKWKSIYVERLKGTQEQTPEIKRAIEVLEGCTDTN